MPDGQFYLAFIWHEKEMNSLQDKYSKIIENKLHRYISLINKVKNINLEIEKLSYISNEDKIIKSLEKIKRTKEIEIEKINNALSVLDIRQRKIIELRYIGPELLEWNKISEIMDLTDTTCRTIRNEAIEKMVPIIFIKNDSEKIS